MRFGVVGTSFWAREIHAAGVAAQPEATLAGVWGRDAAKARAVAGAHGVESYTDFDAFLSDVDAVTFSVPPHVQAELAVRAAAAGKHLLLEKPLAVSTGAAERITDAVTGAEVAALVFFTDRFLPAGERWLDSVRGTALGGSVVNLASLQTPGNPFADSPWRKVEGALWDVGPHALATLLPVLGPVAEITGARGPGDLVHLVLTHVSGALSTVALSLTMPPDAQRHSVEFYSADGWSARPDRGDGALTAHTNAVGELVAMVRDGRREHRCDAHFGREVVEVLERAQRVLNG